MTDTKQKDNKILVTPEGYKALKVEYDNLVNIQRPANVDMIIRAREMGDLSENGMYSAAKEKQSFIEGRILEIEEILKKVEIVEKVSGSKQKVDVGSKVTVNITQKDIVFHIVGGEEVDSTQNKISHESPLGAALMGKSVGDQVEVDAPAGKVSYKIIKII